MVTTALTRMATRAIIVQHQWRPRLIAEVRHHTRVYRAAERAVIEIVFRLDPDDPTGRKQPRDADEARRALETGNLRFVSLGEGAPTEDRRQVIPIHAGALGLSDVAGREPKQSPFAVVLGCADARVPVELIFQRAANDLFVVRVAGNVLGNVCLGSIEYALAHLSDSVRLVVVLGHTRCGAVTAAVDAFLAPGAYPDIASTRGLRAVVDGLFVAVRSGAMALEGAWGPDVVDKPGYRQALIETSVIANTALTARTLQDQADGAVEVVYGVYDLISRLVRVTTEGDSSGGLRSPPQGVGDFEALNLDVARSEFIVTRLNAQ